MSAPAWPKFATSDEVDIDPERAIAEALTGVFRDANADWQHGDLLGAVISVGPADPRYSLMGRQML